MSAKSKAATCLALVLALGGGIVVFLTTRGGGQHRPPSTAVARGGGEEHEKEDTPEGAEKQHYLAAAYPKRYVAPALSRGARRAAGRVPRRLTRADFAPGALAANGRASAAALGGTRTWTPLGPAGGPVDPFIQEQQGELPITAGRVTALVISPKCVPGDCRLWLGAAGGGVWRTDDALAQTPAWEAIDRGLDSQAIGSLALDPNDTSHKTIYAGTGEGNFSFASQAGVGLYKSVDGGDSWSLVPGSRPLGTDNSISAVAIDPTDSSVIWLGTSFGLRGSKDTAALYNARTAHRGVYKSTDGGASFHLEFEPSLDGVTGVVVDPTQHDTVYAATRETGVWRTAPSLEGTADWKPILAGTTRSSVAIASHSRVWITDGRGDDPQSQGEVFRIDNADLPAAQVTATQVSSPANGASGFCEYQCFYDQAIAVDPAHPDTAWIGGQVDGYEGEHGESNGRAVLRTLDGGQTWTDMTTQTAQEDRGTHPDLHAIVLDPADPGIAFLGSDGGIVRTNGQFADGYAGGPEHRPCTTDRCHALLSSIPTQIIDMNAGLDTLQLVKIAVPNNASGDVLAGMQDNGTFLRSGKTRAWTETLGGDGAIAAIDATDPRLRVTGHFGATPVISGRGGIPDSWSDIKHNLPEGFQVMPLIADPVTHRTLFAGADDLWRTTDVGHSGWAPLGFTQGTISALGRTPADKGTLWAGTGDGHLGFSTNVNARNPADVRFRNVVTSKLPGRFISGIAVDPADRAHAWVSYSGFAANAKPSGHVFSVRFDRKKRTFAVSDVSTGIGDQPVDDLAYDAAARDLYASTDFGVLRLPRG
ncbi:MAG: hypothetical protein QOJ07_3605, partial [Thermoleophilaceae bacterium]|nr:hypothetical protein [Thermoleophilaceae bacterium]